MDRFNFVSSSSTIPMSAPSISMHISDLSHIGCVLSAAFLCRCFPLHKNLIQLDGYFQFSRTTFYYIPGSPITMLEHDRTHACRRRHNSVVAIDIICCFPLQNLIRLNTFSRFSRITFYVFTSSQCMRAWQTYFQWTHAANPEAFPTAESDTTGWIFQSRFSRIAFYDFIQIHISNQCMSMADMSPLDACLLLVA